MICEHRTPSTGAERSVIYHLRWGASDERWATMRRAELVSNNNDEERATMTTMRSKLWRQWASIGVFLVWFWYRGSVLWFFFFFYKQSIGVCFAFALYRLYWGLVFFALSASDVTVGTMGLISDSLCCCCCFYFLFFILNLRVFLILWLRVFLKQLKYNFFLKFFSAQGVPGSTLTYTWRHHCDKLINWWLKFTTNSKDKYLWIFLSLIQL